MTIKEQFVKLKENWLIVGVIGVLLFFMFFSGSMGNFSQSVGNYGMEKMAMADSMDYGNARGGSGYYPMMDEGFSPEVEERKIVKTSSLSTEVERGDFHNSETMMKAIVTASDSYLLNENVNKYGTDKKSYFRGSYSIKVDTTKYDSVVAQLKEIGEIQYFNENARDITGSYTNTEIEIATEKSRLLKFETMYEETEDISDKIELTDRIYNLERTIGYLEDSLENMDQRIEYSTISFSLSEKRSDYANIAFVKFSELIGNLVSSFNSLFNLIFVLIPYSIAALLIWFIVRIVRRR